MYLDEIAAEIAAELGPGDMPRQGDPDRLLRLYALLVRCKGTATTAEDVHDAWSIWMAEVDPSHEAIRPFVELDPEVKAEDGPFLGAIRAVAARRRARG